MKWHEFIRLIGAKEVNEFHQRSDVDSSFKAQHHTLGKKHDQAAPGDHTHDGIGSLPIDLTNLTHRWQWSDRFTVNDISKLSYALTYVPVAESLFVRWHPGAGAGLPVLDEDFDLDNNIISLHNKDEYEEEDFFSFQYEIKSSDTDDLPDDITDGSDNDGDPEDPGYPGVVLGDGATAYYRHGELTAASVMVDSSGNDHHGAYAGGPPYWTIPTLETPGLLTGDADTAATYDGTSSGGVVPDGAWMDGWDGIHLSLECIVNPSNFAAAPFGVRGLICRDENSVTQSRVWAWYCNTAGKILFLKNPGGDGGLGTVTSTSASALSVGTKYHLIVTIDATQIKQYINGVLDVTTPAAFNFNLPSNSRIALGGGFFGGNSPNIAPFAGVRDEEAIYLGTTLTADQAANHAAKAGF